MQVTKDGEFTHKIQIEPLNPKLSLYPPRHKESVTP
jgi:hypothetical protein